MDTKNFILAIALSIFAFVVYQYFFAPHPTKETAPVAKPETAQPEKAQTSKVIIPEHVAVNIQQAVRGRDILIETDLLKAVVNTAGGVITSWELKDYQEADKAQVGLTALYRKIMGQERIETRPKKDLGKVQLLPNREDTDAKNLIFPLTIIPLEKTLYKLAHVEFRTNLDSIRLSKENSSEKLILTYRGPAGIMIEKSLTFYNNDYKVDIGIKTRGLDGYNLSLGTDFGFADKVSSDASGRVGLVEEIDGKFNTIKLEDIKGETQSAGMVNWFGQQDKYFTATILYGDRGLLISKRTVAPVEFGDLLSTELTVKEKVDARNVTLYAGPKSFTTLAAHGHGLEQMVDYGWFSIIAKPMFWLLQFFYDITKNYGIAIILLTIVVRILLFYPSLKSALSMEEMKKMQPQIAELKEKYKKDPKRMNQETMKLYKEHKINPLGGCLPMLLQLPFFVALYNVLSVSIELRLAPFISFWIKDLSVYDPYYVLPVLMGVSMILMMKMTSTTADPQQAKIMMYMNIAFIFLFAWLPAGLLLYITLSNVLSIAQQMYVHRIISRKTA
jgi:YidC/Oxa1 family membrane protein insertase